MQYKIYRHANRRMRRESEESGLHNGCMESLRLPEVAMIMLKEIKYRKVDLYDER